MTVSRTTQEVVEVISNTDPKAVVTQVVVEVISSTEESGAGPATVIPQQLVIAT